MAARIALAALGGAAYFLGFVGFGYWPLIFVCFVPPLFALQGITRWRALGLGVVFGTVTHCGGYYWVIHLLESFAGLATPLALLGFVLLCAYQGLSIALAMVATGYLQRKHNLSPIWGLTICYSLAEWLYPFIFPSFIGNALYKLSPLTQIVDITGMLGLTALVCLVNGAIFEVVQSRLQKRPIPRVPVGVTVVVLVVTLGYGFQRIGHWDEQAAAAPTMKVGLVQTNLGARDKKKKRKEFIRRHQQMSLALSAQEPELDLVVWPESAYNRWIHRDTKNLRRTVLAGLEVPLVFGTLTYQDMPKGQRRQTFNSAVLTSSTGDMLQIFDKVELLAFGETIPGIETFPSVREWKWFERTSIFTRGKSFKNFQVPKDGSQVKLLPMICYEDIIPAFVRKVWQTDGPADALVNVTNDSWYGDTHEPLIHLVLATFRSIETRRALVRSTNTGISAFVDPVGRLVKRTGQWEKATLVHDVPLIKDGGTTIFMKFGNWLGWVLLLSLVVVVVRSRRSGDSKETS